MLRVNLSKNFQFKWAWKCQVWLFLYLIGGNQISILIKLRMRKSVGAYNTLQEALYMDRLLLYFTVKNQNRKSTQENKPSRIMCQKLFSFCGFICRSFNWAKICEEYKTRGWCRIEMQAAASNEKNKNVEILLWQARGHLWQNCAFTYTKCIFTWKPSEQGVLGKWKRCVFTPTVQCVKV